MSVKVYNKKGNIPMKEKKLVSQLQAKITELMNDDPSFKFQPANNASELEDLYKQYCIEDATIVPDNSGASDDNSDDELDIDTDDVDDTSDDYDDDYVPQDNVDPWSKQEPRVRGYVLEDEFGEDVGVDNTKTTFDEPMSFEESFDIPDDSKPNDDLSSSSSGSQSGGQQQQSQQQQSQQRPSQDYVNPAYGDMDSAKQRKKTKRFVKQIVALTCDLLERGFIWYATKDISEAKLTQYELSEEMDLGVLLEMEDGQKQTVKEFFLSQQRVIEREARIDAEDREDLTDALTEVFMEKGIAPTPMQEALLVGAKIVGVQFIKALSITSSNNSVLNQLRAMKKEETPYESYEEPSRPYTPPPVPPQSSEAPTNVATPPAPKTDVIFEIAPAKE